MEFVNENQDTRLQEALAEIKALKQALVKKGTITHEEVENEKS
ncbi:MAG: hypothetical protein AABW89_05165 [Nanoarchaeota archaeon]|mgnify:CR=1 FL=1